VSSLNDILVEKGTYVTKRIPKLQFEEMMK